MALDNSTYIIENTKPTGTPITVTSVPGTETSAPKQPVSFSVKGETDPLTELVKSEEFQRLTDEQKLDRLKNLYPNATEQELKTTLNSVKTSIAAQTKKEDPALTIDDLIARLKTKDPATLTD